MNFVLVILLIVAGIGVFLLFSRITERALTKPVPASITATNPERSKGPPITDAELAELDAWLKAKAKPAVFLTNQPNKTIQPSGPRIGGGALLPSGAEWPTDKRGVPLELVAVIDYDQLPHIEGFPTSGVAQFFITRDDLYGMKIGDLTEGETVVRFDADWTDLQLQPAPPLEAISGAQFSNYSPFQDERARSDGLMMTGEIALQEPHFSSDPAEKRIMALYGRAGEERIDEFVDARPEAPGHHFGGYPVTVQGEFRQPDQLQEFDTVLLRLTSDETIMWGDMGEAVFMIRSADLSQRDFSRVLFHWDCS